MKVALLDINVLLALAWEHHQHHVHAQNWFAGNLKHQWATCAVTQLGFIRLSSNPKFTQFEVSPRDAADLLKQWTARDDHKLLECAPADNPEIYRTVFGHRQITDAWLVEVARQNNAEFVTLDKRMASHSTVSGLICVIDT